MLLLLLSVVQDWPSRLVAIVILFVCIVDILRFLVVLRSSRLCNFLFRKAVFRHHGDLLTHLDLFLRLDQVRDLRLVPLQCREQFGQRTESRLTRATDILRADVVPTAVNRSERREQIRHLNLHVVFAIDLDLLCHDIMGEGLFNFDSYGVGQSMLRQEYRDVGSVIDLRLNLFA